MRIIRVFPRRTNLTPTDNMAFVGWPPLDRPGADEVHISCTFTWDYALAQELFQAWAHYYPDAHISIGGPAICPDMSEFIPGRYVKQGVTFTTRGCNNNCKFCLVPDREGKLRELPIQAGNIINDNNLLQASRGHIEKVFEMLKTQKAVVFAGGIQASLVDDWFAEQLRGVSVREVFLACDTTWAINPLRKAVDKLDFLTRRQLRCYVLIGFDGETIEQAKARLEEVWDAGCLPYTQLYQPPDRERIKYTPEWRALNRLWSWPAAMLANHKEIEELLR